MKCSLATHHLPALAISATTTIFASCAGAVILYTTVGGPWANASAINLFGTVAGTAPSRTGRGTKPLLQ